MLKDVDHSRLLRLRALGERFWGVLTPPPRQEWSRARAAEESRRARLLQGITLLCGLNLVFMMSVHTLLGNHGFVASVAPILPVVIAFSVAVRAGASPKLVGHAAVASIYLVTLWIALATGGLIAGGLFFLALVPAVATLVIDRKAGVGWACAALATLVGLGLYSGDQGLEPWLRLDVADTSQANLRAAGLVLLAVTAMAVFFSRLQDRARADLERLVGIHQEGERRFRAITERAGDLIAELDSRGRFVFASRGFEEALGWEPAALAGERAVDWLHPEDRETAIEGWQVLQEKGTVRLDPVRLQGKSGAVKWFEISMRAYSAADDETRVVSIARDVTDRLEQERLLRRQHRLASGGLMAAGAAHQLANPMAAILAAAEYAKGFEGEPDFASQALESLDAIEEQAIRSARILGSMLAFARDEVAERWVEDLKVILRRAVRAVRSELESSGVELVLSITEADVRANVSPIEIEQVVVNLMRNAIQSGASVVVVGLDIDLRSMATITVSDDGPGLDEASAERAFRAFFSRREVGGAGLGLTVAREIVVAHGGEIALTQSGSEGAVFRVELPIYRLEH